MTLPELYEQQQREIDQFKATRDKAWADLKKEQEEITAAFGSRENLPEDMRKRIDEQLTNYQNTWSMDGGQHYKAIQNKHEKQLQGIGVKAAPVTAQPKPAANANPDQLTERQIELQKIIRQQQAIRERNKQKKMKR